MPGPRPFPRPGYTEVANNAKFAQCAECAAVVTADDASQGAHANFHARAFAAGVVLSSYAPDPGDQCPYWYQGPQGPPLGPCIHEAGHTGDHTDIHGGAWAQDDPRTFSVPVGSHP